MIMKNNKIEFWNNRFIKFGHTGWSDNLIYDYDQSVRINKISSVINKLNVATALDLGCGTGDFIKLIDSLNKQSCIVGVDISDKTIERNKINFVQENIEFIASDLLEYSIKKNKYDLISSITVLQHITNKEDLLQLLKNIKDGLSSKGKFIFLENIYNESTVEDNYLNKNFDKDDWLDVCQEAGLTVEQIYSYPQLGIRLVESIFRLLQFVKSKIKKENKKIIEKNNNQNINIKSSLLRRNITKIILFFSSFFDKILNIDTSIDKSKYLVFVCKK